MKEFNIIGRIHEIYILKNSINGSPRYRVVISTNTNLITIKVQASSKLAYTVDTKWSYHPIVCLTCHLTKKGNTIATKGYIVTDTCITGFLSKYYPYATAYILKGYLMNIYNKDKLITIEDNICGSKEILAINNSIPEEYRGYPITVYIMGKNKDNIAQILYYESEREYATIY